MHIFDLIIMFHRQKEIADIIVCVSNESAARLFRSDK